MTDIYIDCEFNGFGGRLISLAMVSEHHEFYEVLPEPQIWDAWCFDNVRPVLFKDPISAAEFRDKFLKFLAIFSDPVIIADWPADLFYFFQVLLGDSYPQTVMTPVRTKLREISSVSANPHNALADARALRLACI